MWKIFYGDGSSVEVTKEEFGLLEPLNVQCIAQENDRGWHVVSHADFYIFTDDMDFIGVDIIGFWDYMFRPTSRRCVLFGRTIDTPNFQVIHQTALSYADQKRRENK